ncbi:MAG: hypothetical protein BGO40_02890 [Chryseobacterium sp. 39-10]|nr:hypothetical protein [Chryseobacterium sp.]OJV46525.1 MAG: hypothetical protein BGO40_02890 [Chryseobacterium sp. 39-10]
MENYFYKNIDLRVATQQDLSVILEMPISLVSFTPDISEDDERIGALFSFADLNELEDLLEQLRAIYPTYYQ